MKESMTAWHHAHAKCALGKLCSGLAKPEKPEKPEKPVKIGRSPPLGRR